MNLEQYASDYPSLDFSEPHPGVLLVELPPAPGREIAVADAQMHGDLADLWTTLDGDATVRSVLVAGSGEDGFCAGGAYDLIEEMIEDDRTLQRVWREARDLVYNIVNCSKPIVSAIHGPAVGAGLAVALLADVSIAARDARLLDGHVALGVAAGDHAVMIWPLLCGLAKARYHLLTNTTVTGEEAERIGLVSLTVDRDELMERALDVAANLADGSPSAIRWTKYALNNWLRQAGPSFDASLAMEFMGFRQPDVQEGLAARREKRTPNFDEDAW
ncbi:MAG: enoyl-CoA hydratase/isomerase family protein [Pseudomonadota bacterium]